MKERHLQQDLNSRWSTEIELSIAVIQLGLERTRTEYVLREQWALKSNDNSKA